ncbi:hypothetical protein T01_4854 [Trichinella spiralis]|uniref:Uncharacterized protein n=1 Tax=Trichinella spiralis TaxID=6334 RepID=A0A0V1B0M5_TRISP|nr:hypothetical protein T01_4854 [Trichinella spiralis]
MSYAQKLEVPGTDEEDLHMINFLISSGKYSELIQIYP